MESSDSHLSSEPELKKASSSLNPSLLQYVQYRNEIVKLQKTLENLNRKIQLECNHLLDQDFIKPLKEVFFWVREKCTDLHLLAKLILPIYEILKTLSEQAADLNNVIKALEKQTEIVRKEALHPLPNFLTVRAKALRLSQDLEKHLVDPLKTALAKASSSKKASPIKNQKSLISLMGIPLSEDPSSSNPFLQAGQHLDKQALSIQQASENNHLLKPLLLALKALRSAQQAPKTFQEALNAFLELKPREVIQDILLSLTQTPCSIPALKSHFDQTTYNLSRATQIEELFEASRNSIPFTPDEIQRLSNIADQLHDLLHPCFLPEEVLACLVEESLKTLSANTRNYQEALTLNQPA